MQLEVAGREQRQRPACSRGGRQCLVAAMRCVSAEMQVAEVSVAAFSGGGPVQVIAGSSSCWARAAGAKGGAQRRGQWLHEVLAAAPAGVHLRDA